MKVFVDTSGFFAFLNKSDPNHNVAVELFEKALRKRTLFTHSSIIIESVALIQSRLGLNEARLFLEHVGELDTVWIDKTLHEKAVEYFHRHATRRLSFVDCTSFVVMKEKAVTSAIHFDDDFEKAGFRLYQ